MLKWLLCLQKYTRQDLLYNTFYAVIKIMWYWWKNRLRDKWNRVKSSQNDPHKCSQLIFKFFLIGVYLPYNVVLVSAAPQHALALGTHISPSPEAGLHPPLLIPSQPTGLWQRNKTIQQNKDSLFNQECCNNWTSKCTNRSEHTYYTLHKNYLNWPKCKMQNQET